MENQLLYVLGALMLASISLAQISERETEAELPSDEKKMIEMKFIEAHLHNIQQAAKKTDRITLVVEEIINTSNSRCLRYTPDGELLERVREIVGSLKINPNYKGAKRNHIFKRWSPSIEIALIPGSAIYYAPDGKKHEEYVSYCILADTVGSDSTSLYYLDAEKLSELRKIFSTIWKDKTGQDPPSSW